METKRPKVLVVDDNEVSRRMLETLLKGTGHEVASARNGAEALEKLHAQDFDIIVTDILMPVMDGFQLCMRVKQDDRLRGVPLVFYTAVYTDEHDEELALAMGANKFIRKPMEPAEFPRVISEVLAEVTEGGMHTSEPFLKKQEVLFQRYNERVVNKLEQKTRELEQEIAERKKAEEALRQSEQFSRRLVDHAPIGMAYLAEDGTLQYINPAGNAIMGIPEGQSSILLGRNVAELPGLHDRSKTEANLRRVFEGESISDLEVPYTSSMGRDTLLLVAATPRFSSDGTVEGAVLIFTDIADRKKTEELQRQTARFRAVADLAAGVAHNFNNLLQVVIGNTQLALMDLEAGDFVAVRDSMEKVIKSSRFGADLVRRLQAFTRARRLAEVSATGVFDLSGVAGQAVDVSQSWLTAAEKEGRKVSLFTRLKEGCLIKADEKEIFGVVVDLIRNAVEALLVGGDIDLATNVQGDHVILRISDTGIGISPENLGRLFNPFFTKKTEAGSGLSLAAARKIVEDSGGHILADSAEGKGTTFTVSFPLARTLPEPAKVFPEQEATRPLSILVIDDMEVINDLMKSALTAAGHSVLTALSGEQGIGIFREIYADLVICDLGMPGMTGWEVGESITAICKDRGIPKPPFILLTAWEGQEMETEKIARSGVDEVVAKPVNLENILKIVRDIREREPLPISQ